MSMIKCAVTHEKKLISTAVAVCIAASVLCGCSDSGQTAEHQTDINEIEVEEVTTSAEITTGATTETTTETTTEVTTETTTEVTTVTTLVDTNRETVLRNVCWGDTMDIVKYVEKDELMDSNNNTLWYKTSVSDISANLLYNFDDSYGLYNASYLFDSDYFTSGLVAIGQYNKLVESITAKYGEPLENSERILDSTMYKYSDSNAQAVELGYLAYYANWQYGDTKIDLILATLNYKTNISLQFKDSTFDPPTNTDGL